MIKVSKAVEEAKNAVFTGLTQYRAPLSRELEGKYFDIVFDDGYKMFMSFPARNKVEIQDANGKHFENCEVLKAEEGAFFIMCEFAGSNPRSAIMMVIDVFEKLVTCVFAKQGEDASFPELVTREVRFGALKDGDAPLPEKRHEYTRDLVGNKITWQYSPSFAVTHVYLPDNYYTTHHTAEENAKFDEMLKEKGLPPRKEPYYEENCIYIKLRENLYLFSFVEKNSSGTQGLMVINTDRITDVGCFWGTNREKVQEAYTFNAYGMWMREHVEEDDIVANLKAKKN